MSRLSCGQCWAAWLRRRWLSEDLVDSGGVAITGIVAHQGWAGSERRA